MVLRFPKLIPFSRNPGSRFQIPGSLYFVEAYPAAVCIYQMEAKSILCAIVKWKGSAPFDEFIVQQNLEKGEIHIEAKSGLENLRLCLFASLEGVNFTFFKVQGTFTYKYEAFRGVFLSEQSEKSISCGDLLFWREISLNSFIPSSFKISFGSHKSLQWQKIQEDFKSLCPILIALGSSTPSAAFDLLTIPLMSEAFRALELRLGDKVFALFKKIYKSYFEPHFIPLPFDGNYWGFPQPEKEVYTTEILFLSAQLLKKLFIQCNDQKWEILPALPKYFRCGRMEYLTEKRTQIECIWSEAYIRSIVIRPDKEEKITLETGESSKKCRIRHAPHEKGKRIDIPCQISFDPQKLYILDRFER